jgi:hypothetical protein
VLTRILCVTLLVTAGAAVAQTPTGQQTTIDKNKTNKVICEKVERLGSRIATQRVCMTAEEWATKRQLDREETEGVQRRTFQPGN